MVLSKIGRVAVRWSRPIEGEPKTVTIAREPDGWSVILSCADVPAQPLPPTGQATGIDVGLQVFLVTAAGEVIENPRHYRQAEKRLIKAQRKVARARQPRGSRREKGGSRREKGGSRREKGAPGGGTARQGAPAGQAPARRLPPQDRAGVTAPVRRHLSRRSASRQPGPESSPRHVHRGRGLGAVPHRPRRHGSMRRPSGDCGSARLHGAGLQRLRGARAQELERAHPRLHQLRPGARSG